MTKCEELQFNLPWYFDGGLSQDERSAIDAHLPECPLCRQKLSEFEDLSAGFKSISAIDVPDDLIDAIRVSVRANLAPTSLAGSPVFGLIDRRRRWTDIWLVPSMVGTAATLVIGIALLSFVVSSSPVPLTAFEASRRSGFDTPIFLANTDLSPENYAGTRLAIANESPSVNPRGALVALTKSLVRGEMRDDEVVVVADVFGNGLASIAEVVEPSHDQRAIEELQKALQSDPAFAPFVPANMDQRSENIRVILKIQNVNVNTHSDR
jgi:hypothetical protein